MRCLFNVVNNLVLFCKEALSEVRKRDESGKRECPISLCILIIVFSLSIVGFIGIIFIGLPIMTVMLYTNGCKQLAVLPLALFLYIFCDIVRINNENS